MTTYGGVNPLTRCTVGGPLYGADSVCVWTHHYFRTREQRNMPPPPTPPAHDAHPLRSLALALPGPLGYVAAQYVAWPDSDGWWWIDADDVSIAGPLASGELVRAYAELHHLSPIVHIEE